MAMTKNEILSGILNCTLRNTVKPSNFSTFRLILVKTRSY